MSNKLILIIEDNELNSKLVRDVLTFKGYQTIEAVTAEDGIKLALERLPVLILMDYQLPGMNGIEAFKVLRSNPITAHIPVIAVTASAMVSEQQAMIQAGFDGIHTKPIHVLTFLASVQSRIEKTEEK